MLKKQYKIQLSELEIIDLIAGMNLLIEKEQDKVYYPIVKELKELLKNG